MDRVVAQLNLVGLHPVPARRDQHGVKQRSNRDNTPGRGQTGVKQREHTGTGQTEVKPREHTGTGSNRGQTERTHRDGVQQRSNRENTPGRGQSGVKQREHNGTGSNRGQTERTHRDGVQQSGQTGMGSNRMNPQGNIRLAGSVGH